MKQIPLFKVYMSDESIQKTVEVLKSGYIGQGTVVDEFEEQLKKYFNHDYILTLNSATSAEHLALHLLKKQYGLQDGDEVLTSPFTCTATNFPILANNFNIKWVDINPNTLNMDLDDLARKLTCKTKAIMLIHWGGYPNDLDKINEILNNSEKIFGFRPVIIEDCAHSMGSKYKGKYIGTHGNLCTFSLQAIKHVTAGDGGLLFTPNVELYNRGKLLRWYGIDRNTNKKDFRCLHPSTLIKFSDGTTEKISNVVKNKIDKEILVYENGTFKSRKIKNWITSELGDRNFMKVSTSRISNKNVSIMTNDHKVLTKNRGWIRIDNLIKNEEILTSFYEPNEKQKELIIGSLLGDSSISVKKTKKIATTGVMSETHSLLQMEYAKMKIDALNKLIATTHTYDPCIDNRGVKSNGKITYFTKSLPYFGDLRKEFYPTGKKIIAKELIEKYFSDFMLAIWFMDDGRTQVSNSKEGLKYDCDISAESFVKEDVEWLIDFISSKGYNCYLYNTNKKLNSGYKILFTRDGSKKLINNISKYVPKSMRYKVGHIENNFDNKLWNLGEPNGYYDNVIINKNLHNNYKTTYCLEIDSEYSNFQTSSVVVHNCEADVEEWGFKFHMNDINASIGIGNFNKIEEIIGKHKSNAKFYDNELNDIDDIDLLERNPDMDSAFWIYSMKVQRRSDFMAHMKKYGIAVSQVHERNDIHTTVKKYKTLLPNLDRTIKNIISIPVGWWVTEEDRKYIVDIIKKGW